MKYHLTLLAFCLTAVLAQGRVYEDLPALEERYGKPVFVWSEESSPGTYAEFFFQGRKIEAVLLDGDTILEVIHFDPVPLNSTEEAEKVGGDSARFVMGLMSKAYGWPDETAAELVTKLGKSVTHNEITAKYVMDALAIRTKNQFIAQVFVMHKAAQEGEVHEQIMTVLNGAAKAKAKSERESQAEGF